MNGKIERKTDANWRKTYVDQGDDHPVTGVSWSDAGAFCEWMSGKTGRRNSRPTEVEWEYACRAGTETLFYTGDAENDLGRAGWYYGNSGDRNLAASEWDGKTLGAVNCRTHPVGRKVSSTWGLFDMHGNVREWCRDRYGRYAGGSVTNPPGPGSGSGRVIRGGGWGDGAGNCRSAIRGGLNPSKGCSFLGFRVVRRP